MNLVAPVLLTFGLFAAVPFVLHLYHKRKRTVALFSTNRFFTESVSQSQRRMQLHRVLLMLLRMAACLLIAGAVARPFIRAGSGAAAAGRRDVVLLMDDTLSMSAATDSESNFDRARAAAIAIVEKLDRDDRVVVLTCSPPRPERGRYAGPPQLTRDKASVVRTLRELQPGQGGGAPLEALKEAARLLKTISSRAPLLVVVTDMQAGQWPETLWPQPDEAVPVAVVQVGQPAPDNIWIEEARLSPPVLLPGRTAALEVSLRSGSQKPQQVQLRVRLGDQLAGRTTVDLEALGRRREQVALNLVNEAGEPAVMNAAALSGGSEQVRIEAELQTVDDPIKEDDIYYLTGNALPRLPVLLLDGQTSRTFRRRAAFYVVTALQSLPDTPVDVEQAPVGQAPWSSLDNYRAVMICGARNLPNNAVDALVAYVRGGGGLMLIPGESPDLEFYNQRLAPEKGDRLLPGPLKELVTIAREADPMHIRQAEWEHEIFRRFADEFRSAVADISVRRVWTMDTGDAWVLAQLDGGLPLLMERRLGEGTVITLASMPEPDWTELPLSRNFVGLLNRSVTYLAAGRGHTEQHEVGRDMPWRDGSEGDVVSVVCPDGVTARTEMRGGQTTPYLPASAVDQPGFYQSEGKDGSVWIATANSPRSESVVDTGDRDRLREAAEDWELEFVDASMESGSGGIDVEAVSEQVLHAGRPNRALWDTFLWIALVALTVEPLVANRLSGGRRTTAESSEESGGESA